MLALKSRPGMFTELFEVFMSEGVGTSKYYIVKILGVRNVFDSANSVLGSIGNLLLKSGIDTYL